MHSVISPILVVVVRFPQLFDYVGRIEKQILNAAREILYYNKTLLLVGHAADIELKRSIAP